MSNSVLFLFFLPSVSCTFSCTMKYLVRDCDPNTGEPDDDGYDDEYVVSAPLSASPLSPMFEHDLNP